MFMYVHRNQLKNMSVEHLARVFDAEVKLVMKSEMHSVVAWMLGEIMV